MPLFERKEGAYRRTRSLWGRIKDLATMDAVTLARGLDVRSLEDLEETLIGADFGAGPASQVVEEVRGLALQGRLRGPGDFHDALAREMLRLLRQSPEETALRENPRAGEPTCYLVAGVNGVGKTTTIAKIAARAQGSGRSVLLVAGDTFRAGAVEQLRVWGERLGCDVVSGGPRADPAAVAFNGVEAALARGMDLVICDTAGRLHTQHDLMQELGKLERVVARRLEGAPHETLLVLDATIGQNAIAQSYVFRQALSLSGIVLTKLDGTARGGVAVAVRQELGLPIKLVGTGEALEDLSVFDPQAFVEALLAPTPA
ncbi:MAG: signal recognition particle-docking protein FtsY [Gemmatimonadota bacterium]